MITTTHHLVMARLDLQAALTSAEHDRDRAVFEINAGQRSPTHSIRVIERVGLIRSQLQIMDQLLPPVPQQEEAPDAAY